MNNTAKIVNIEQSRGKMPSKNGYVMAWRDIAKQDWYSNPECLAVFTHLMLNATSRPMTFNRKGVDVSLSEGQFATSYEDLAKVFNLNKSKVRRFIALFEKKGQITHSIITLGRINKGIIITFCNWNKWQKPLENTDTPTDTLSDTPKRPFLKVCEPYTDTPPDTQTDRVLNNNLLNNNKEHACFENKPLHLEIRNKGFEHFWKVWGSNKKLIGKLNTAPKQTTKTKFLSLMNESHVKKIGVDGFRTEINQMCELISFAHNDILEKQTTKQQSDFFNFESMYPAKFLSNKQWRDWNGEQS